MGVERGKRKEERGKRKEERGVGLFYGIDGTNEIDGTNGKFSSSAAPPINPIKRSASLNSLSSLSTIIPVQPKKKNSE